MPAARQYLRVERVAAGDFFLRSRTDLADGQPFRRGDVVTACGACRQVSKRIYWQKAGNTCPFCGSSESLLYHGRKSLEDETDPPVRYTSRRLRLPENDWLLAFLISLAAVVFCIAVFLVMGVQRVSKDSGFVRASDGRYYHLDEEGVRSWEGDYLIDGVKYRFEDGYLKGESSFYLNDRLLITGEDGRVHKGWTVHEGILYFQDDNGVVSNRVPDGSGDRFVSLEGVGLVFLTGDNQPGEGWITFDGGLYHLHEGKADPVGGLQGSFDEKGRFFPDEAGFVRTEDRTYFVDGQGRLLTGLVVFDGFVYNVQDKSYSEKDIRYYTGEFSVLASEEEPENYTGIITTGDGALRPETDVLLECSGGSVVVEGKTGKIRTGWLLYPDGLYYAGEDCYILQDRQWSEPAGYFGADGRFIPEKAGRMTAGGVTCHLMEDGTPVTGCVREGDALCIYDERGAIMTGSQVLNIGMTDESGYLRPYASGMYTIEGDIYCLSQQGKLLTGWQYSQKLYYFDPTTGRRCSEGMQADGLAYPLSGEGYFIPPAEGMYRLGDAEYYIKTDGTAATGWQAVGSSLVYFDEQTARRRDDIAEEKQTGWVQTDSGRYYIGADGSVARGWQIIDNSFYYFDPADGRTVSGSVSIDGRTYSFREDGRLSPGTATGVVAGGTAYRVGADGSPEGGFLYADGHLYYYEEEGAALASALPEKYDGWLSAIGAYIVPQKEGPYKAGKDSYYLDKQGSVMTGWFVSDSRLWYADPQTGYLHSDSRTEDGVFSGGTFTPAEDGIFEADGKEYYFADGRLVSGWIAREDSLAYCEENYHFISDTVTEIDGETCEFDGEGKYIPKNNRIIIQADGKRLFVLAGGSLPDKEGIYPAEGRLVFVLKGGKVADSAISAGLDAAAVRIDEGFIIPVSPGITELFREKYLLREDGSYATDIELFNSKLYCFGPDGRMLVNTEGFGSDGYYVPQKPGVESIHGSKYLFLDDKGTVAVGLATSPEDGQTYYADKDGKLIKGFVTIDGNRYYFYENSELYYMAWNEILNGIFDGDGIYSFYANENGVIQTGWKEINGVLHYFDEKGHMLFDTVKDGKYINIQGEAW